MGSRKLGVFFGVAAIASLLISGAALYSAAGQCGGEKFFPPCGTRRRQVAAQTVLGRKKLLPAALPLSFVTEPQDGIEPVEQLIESASSSVDVVMYEFEDAQLEQLLAQEAEKGIAVRVLLDNGYFGAGSSANQEAFEYLRDRSVQVRWSPQYFALTHEKSLVVDGREALIMTFNFSPQYYASDRDFGVIDTDRNDVAAIEQAFDSDWNGRHVAVSGGDDLVWSPGSRPQLLDLIESATSSLEIYNEEMDDPHITAALEAAAKRGVDVEVDMTYSANWESAFQALSAAGVHVRTYAADAALYIHAKVIIADDAKAFVGSENFSPTSLDQNRELGIIVSDPMIISQLAKIFRTDWQGASPFAVQ